MASGGSEIPHGKTELKMKVTGDDFGPLSVVGNSFVKSFRGGNYWITTPKEDFLILYRFYGGDASEDGQFWTVERHDADQSFRDEHAVARRWNTLEDISYLVVPKGVLMYEGIAATHGPYPGGGWQVFIPQSVLKPLFHFPKEYMARNSKSDNEKWEAEKAIAFRAQGDIINLWNKKRMEKITWSKTGNLKLRDSEGSEPLKMASGGSEIPHGKTELKMKITADEFGPLSVVGDSYVKSFRGGNYWITTPKEDFLILHRFFGGAASDDGQFWKVERHEADQSFRDEHAVARRWNSNTLEDITRLIVPKGVYMFEGIAASRGKYPGGGLQVFIPQSIAKPLSSISRLHMAGALTESDIWKWKAVLDTVGKAQEDIFNRWNKKRIEKITSNSANLALRGKHFRSLPPKVQEALRNPTTGRSAATKEKIPQGTYKLHEERIRHIDGSYQTLSLSVKTEFVKSTTRTYQSGKVTIVETTHHYNIIYIWS